MSGKRVSYDSAYNALSVLAQAQPKPAPRMSVKEFVNEHRNDLLEQIKRLGQGNEVWGRVQVCEALSKSGIDINPDRLRDLLKRRRKRKNADVVEQEEIHDQVRPIETETPIEEKRGFFQKAGSG